MKLEFLITVGDMRRKKNTLGRRHESYVLRF